MKSFLNQSQQNLIILLGILSCTFVPNLSKVRLLTFPWQHILETALMQNRAIQLSNDVTVTLFLHQSSKKSEKFLEIISSTSVQNYRQIKCFLLPWEHNLLRVLMPNLGLRVSDNVTVTSFLKQPQQNFVFLFVMSENISVQYLSKIRQETNKLQKLGNDVISKNSSAFCV